MCAFVQLVNFSCCCFGKNPQWPRPSHILVHIHEIGKKSLMRQGRCNCPAANTVYCVCVWFLKGWPISWWPAVHLHFWHRIYNCLEKIERESCFYAYVLTYILQRAQSSAFCIIDHQGIKNWNSQLEMDMDFRNPVVLYFTL